MIEKPPFQISSDLIHSQSIAHAFDKLNALRLCVKRNSMVDCCSPPVMGNLTNKKFAYW